MANFSASDVKKLRELTGAGMMDCKKALEEAGGNMDQAAELLRKKGIAKAEKRGGRTASQGVVVLEIAPDQKSGAMVELNCETDFVARNEDFQALAKDIAMHIAAASPTYVRREEIPADVLEKEKEIQRHQLKEAGKPEAMWDKILVGKLEKYYETVCLVDQFWVKDDKKRIHEMVTERAAKIGEKVSIRRFARFVVGEGIEKKKDDLAAEVAKTLGQA